MAMTKPKSSQIEHRGESVQKVIDDITQEDGVLVGSPDWGDVPKLKGANANKQAQALVNRTEYLLENSAIRLSDYSELRSYTGDVLAVDITQTGIEGRFNCKGVVAGSTDNGGTNIKDASGRLWVREYKGSIKATWFGEGSAGVSAALASVMGAVVETNDATLTGTITIGSFDKLDGLMRGYGSRIAGQILMPGVLSTLENYQINSSVGSPAIHCNPNNSNEAYYQIIRDIHINGPEGLLVNSKEALVENVRVIGTGRENPGTAVDVTAYDLSIRNLYSEKVQRGLVTNKGVNGFDLHIVHPEQAIRLVSSGQPTHLNQIYLDHAEKVGINLVDNSNACIDHVYALNTGDGWSNNTEPTAFLFQLNSRYNKISKVTFQQNGPTAQDLLKFSSESYNNVLYGFGGSYALTQSPREHMRNQTVLGCTGGWARHNNITRKCRANVAGLGAGLTAELVFRLDWSYPEVVDNTTLFKGVYVSRNAYQHASVGEVWIPIQHGDTGCQPTLYKKMGGSTDAWSIVSATLDGDLLKVVVKNDGTGLQGSIAMEIERCIDTRGAHF